MAKPKKPAKTQRRNMEAALARVARIIGSGKDIATVLKSLAREGKKLVEADACSILLLDSARQELVFHQEIGHHRWDVENIRFRLGEGIAGRVAASGRPIRVQDADRDRRFLKIQGQRSKIRSLACVPLTVRGKVIGVLSAHTKDRVNAFTPSDVARLSALGSHIALNIENHRLYELSVRDSLTHLYNHAYFVKRLAEELSYCRRFRLPLSMVMLDIDHFKQVNDTHGHPAGDTVLVSVARLLEDSLRDYDIPARYGGEEFSLLAPNTGPTGVRALAERLRRQIAEAAFSFAGKKLQITVSLGVATFPDDAQDPTVLVRKADKALYRAKRGGRNRVC